jgi:hypothetical protein
VHTVSVEFDHNTFAAGSSMLGIIRQWKFKFHFAKTVMKRSVQESIIVLTKHMSGNPCEFHDI